MDVQFLIELERNPTSDGHAIASGAMVRGALAGLIGAGNVEEPTGFVPDWGLQAIYQGIAANTVALSGDNGWRLDAFLDRLREMIELHVTPGERSDLDKVLVAVKFSIMTTLARGALDSPTGPEMGAAVWFMNHFGFEP